MSIVPRSNLPETRNPLLRLPAAQRLAELPGDSRGALRELLLQLGREANEKAALCWRTHKAPMAAYWKAVAVYARHLSTSFQATCAEREQDRFCAFINLNALSNSEVVLSAICAGAPGGGTNDLANFSSTRGSNAVMRRASP
jgi:hypothetical protein